MITAASKSRLTTVVGALVAMLGYALSPQFAESSGVDLVNIIPQKYAPIVQLLGAFVAMIGPSLKKSE